MTEPSRNNNESRIKSIWKGLKIAKGTPVEKYLLNRGINILPGRDCYYHPSIQYWEDGESIGEFDAMVSVFRNVDNKVSTLHITYLDDEGNKLSVDHPKKILPVILPMNGCGIRLFEPDRHIALAEGVETALAVYQLENIPCWATGSAGNTEKIELPQEVKFVTIYVDEDENYAGAKAAYHLANRLSIKGLRVRMCRLNDAVKRFETGIKYDFLDYLNS